MTRQYVFPTPQTAQDFKVRVGARTALRDAEKVHAFERRRRSTVRTITAVVAGPAAVSFTISINHPTPTNMAVTAALVTADSILAFKGLRRVKTAVQNADAQLQMARFRLSRIQRQ